MKSKDKIVLMKVLKYIEEIEEFISGYSHEKI